MLAKEVELRLPQTSEEVRESLIVFWHRSEGDWVKQGDVLVEVQTEKAVFEIEAPVTGRLVKILAQRGEVAAVDDVLAILEPAAEAAADPLRQTAATLEQARETEGSHPAEQRSVRASPRVRRLAKELGVDLSTLVGTGPDGRITEKDVRKAVSFRDEEEERRPLTPVRRTIAKRMVESLQQSAQATITAWADVTRLSDKRREWAPDIGFTAWILRAVVLALGKHPHMNAVWEETSIRIFPSVHLGVAVDTEEGLLVPVIPRADRLTLRQLDEAMRQVTEKARNQKLSEGELKGSTFTVSNLGPYGVQFFTPILNPPETALLGVGQVDTQVILQGDRPVQRQRLPLSLTFDHRIVDGAPAARFLQTLIHLLDEPDRLV
jgi:pyruvate dehydrogenase E2 component (dihydrolipoamide acetyltransferase)